MTNTDENGGWRGRFAGGALALSLLAVVWIALAPIGTKLGLWSWQFGLGKMIGNLHAGYGRYVIALAALFSVAAIFVSLISAPRKRPFMLSLGALLIISLVGFRWIGFQMNVVRLPPLHDIQTDWANSIMPSSALIATRDVTKAPNGIEEAPKIKLSEDQQKRWPGMEGRLVSEVQEEAEFNPERQKKEVSAPYPHLETLVLPSVPFDMAYQAALDTVNAKGWKIVTAEPEEGRIEATETSFWFEFKDDIMIRVLPEGESGSRIDVRSVSRVGLSDLGMNAKRVEQFFKDFKARL